MMFTVYNIKTHKIVARQRIIPYQGVPDGCDWIAGDVDDVRFRINPENGKPYPFIDQSQLPWLIRKKAKRKLAEIGMTDTEVQKWVAQRELLEYVNEVVIAGERLDKQSFKKKFSELMLKRSAILNIADNLTRMVPIPQDAEDDKHWRV